jgi:catechol 2,3-dioxygenase-like lactoylglutathione lyase family enzyme
MIRGVHTMFYSSRADELRAFIRDVLGFSYTDVGEGWLIFDAPEADLGVHPSDASAPHAQAGTHAISFYCDQIERTVAGLKAKGVEFTAPVEDHGYGLVTYFKMPGEVLVQLYQPHYVKRRKSAPQAAAPAARRKSKATVKKKSPPKTNRASRTKTKGKRK